MSISFLVYENLKHKSRDFINCREDLELREHIRAQLRLPRHGDGVRKNGGWCKQIPTSDQRENELIRTFGSDVFNCSDCFASDTSKRRKQAIHMHVMTAFT